MDVLGMTGFSGWTGISGIQPIPILTVTDNGFDTIILDWTDPTERFEGIYSIRANGVEVASIGFSDPKTYNDTLANLGLNYFQEYAWSVMYVDNVADVQSSNVVPYSVGTPMILNPIANNVEGTFTANWSSDPRAALPDHEYRLNINGSTVYDGSDLETDFSVFTTIRPVIAQVVVLVSGSEELSVPSNEVAIDLPIVLSVIDNQDGTAGLTWTDSATRADGNYRVYKDGVQVATVAYNATKASTVTVNDPSGDKVFRVDYYNGSDVYTATGNSQSMTISGDTDGELLADAAEAAGFSFTVSKPKAALIDFFSNCRADGLLPLLHDFCLPIFGLAATNRLKWITRTNITYTGGTTTHNTGNITFSSNGYANWEQGPQGYGSTVGNVSGFVIHDAAVAGVAGNDLVGGAFEITSRWTDNNCYCRTFGATAQTQISVNTSGLTYPGILFFSRNGATGYVRQYRFSNSTATSVSTNASMSGGTIIAGNLFWGAAGTPTNYTNRAYKGAGFGTAFTTTQADDLFTNLHTLFSAWSLL